MIDKAIVCGVRRGRKLLSRSELSQMIGRAGRSYTKSGVAYVLVPSVDISKASAMVFGKNPPVESTMNDVSNVAFHLLPMIVSGIVVNEKTFDDWYSKTLAFIQGFRVPFKDVVSFLEENESASIFCNKLMATEFGKISSKFYFRPDRLFQLKNRMSEVADCTTSRHTNSPEVLSWMLSYDSVIVGGVDEMELGGYKSSVQSQGYYFDSGELLHGFVYNCLMINHRPKWLSYVIDGERRDFGRLMNAFRQVVKLFREDFLWQLDAIELSVMKRVPLEVSMMMSDCGVDTKTVGLELYEMGIRNKEDFEEKKEYMILNGSESVRRCIRNMETEKMP